MKNVNRNHCKSCEKCSENNKFDQFIEIKKEEINKLLIKHINKNFKKVF